MLNLLSEHWPLAAAIVAGLYAAFPRLKTWVQAKFPGFALPASASTAGTDLDVTTEHVKELIRGAKSQEQIDDVLAYYAKHTAKAAEKEVLAK